jgi:ATP-binding cassette, subfamily B (MDR/TAP), member 1
LKGSSGRGGLNVIMITYVRDLMEFSDNIVMMEAGAVAEEGRFEDLMKRKGNLWEMLQAGGAQEQGGYKEEDLSLQESDQAVK